MIEKLGGCKTDPGLNSTSVATLKAEAKRHGRENNLPENGIQEGV